MALNKMSSAQFHGEWEDPESPIGEKVFFILLTVDGCDVAQKLIQRNLAKGKRLPSA